jgi:hypothetical protein
LSSNVIRNQVGSPATPHVLGGSLVDYQIAVTGPSTGGTAGSSLAFATPIPAQMELFVGDLGIPGSGPVAFADADSGLSLDFGGLANTSDAVAFSNNGGQSFDYVPRADTDGYDGNVTHISMKPAGTLMPTMGSHARFTLRYRVRIK